MLCSDHGVRRKPGDHQSTPRTACRDKSGDAQRLLHGSIGTFAFTCQCAKYADGAYVRTYLLDTVRPVQVPATVILVGRTRRGAQSAAHVTGMAERHHTSRYTYATNEIVGGCTMWHGCGPIAGFAVCCVIGRFLAGQRLASLTDDRLATGVSSGAGGPARAMGVMGCTSVCATSYWPRVWERPFVYSHVVLSGSGGGRSSDARSC